MLCHKIEREQLKAEFVAKMLKELENKHNIRTFSKSKVLQGYITLNKIRKFQKSGREERKMEIVKKLIDEWQRENRTQKILNKTYDRKVKRKEQIIKDMAIVGTKIELVLPYYHK